MEIHWHPLKFHRTICWKLNEINWNPLEIRESGFCADAESCGQGSTWIVARIVDLSPERDECCCLFFATSVSWLLEFLPLQLRRGGLATVLSAGPRTWLKFIKLQIEIHWKSNEIHWNPWTSIEFRWTFNEILWHPMKFIGNPLEIQWNPLHIRYNSFEKLIKSMEILQTSMEIHLNSIEIQMTSIKIRGNQLNPNGNPLKAFAIP